MSLGKNPENAAGVPADAFALTGLGNPSPARATPHGLLRAAPSRTPDLPLSRGRPLRMPQFSA